LVRPLVNSLGTLRTILVEKLSSQNINLGAPIIGADVKLLTVSMITDPSNKNTQSMTVEYLPTTLPNKKVDKVVENPEIPLVLPISTPKVITSPPIYNNTVI
jgi:hypothetical protein